MYDRRCKRPAGSGGCDPQTNRKEENARSGPCGVDQDRAEDGAATCRSTAAGEIDFCCYGQLSIHNRSPSEGTMRVRHGGLGQS